MKSITLSADERLIDCACEEARGLEVTLDQLFRGWLEKLAASRERRQQAATLLARLEHVDSGGKFSREAMNER